MAKVTIPLTYTIRAKDEGLEREQKKAASGFERIADVIRNASGAVMGMMHNQVELTTQREADLTHLRRSAREALFALGKTDDSLVRQAERIADSWNISGDQAANAVLGFKKAGSVIKKAGLDVDSFALIAKESGSNANELGEQVAGLTKIFHGDEKAAAKAFQQFYEGAQQTGDLGEAFSNFGSFVDDLRTKSLQAAGSDNASLSEFVAGYTKLAAVAKKSTKLTAKDALGLAKSLGESQLDARESFEGMFAGVESDVPKFLTSMGIIKGDVNDAMKDMSKDPLKFVSSMSQMAFEMHKQGKDTGEAMNLIHRQMIDALGKDTGQKIFQIFQESAQDATGGVAQSWKEASATLGDVTHGQVIMVRRGHKMIQKITQTIGQETKDFLKKDLRTRQEWADRTNAITREHLRDQKTLDHELALQIQLADQQRAAIDKLPPSWKPFISDLDAGGLAFATMNDQMKAVQLTMGAFNPMIDKTVDSLSPMLSVLTSVGGLIFGSQGLLTGFGLLTKTFKGLAAGGEAVSAGLGGGVLGKILGGAPAVAAAGAAGYGIGKGVDWLSSKALSSMTGGKIGSIGEGLEALYEKAGGGYKGQSIEDIKRRQKEAAANQARTLYTPAAPTSVPPVIPPVMPPVIPTSGVGTPVKATPMPGVPLPTGGVNALQRSVRDPDWYSGDFKQLFSKKIDELISAVHAMVPGTHTAPQSARERRKHAVGGVSQNIGAGTEYGTAVSSTGQPVTR